MSDSRLRFGTTLRHSNLPGESSKTSLAPELKVSGTLHLKHIGRAPRVDSLDTSSKLSAEVFLSNNIHVFVTSVGETENEDALDFNEVWGARREGYETMNMINVHLTFYTPSE